MLVTTYTGKKVERQKCKKIKGSYYLVGDIKIKDSGECYKVEGKFHRFNNGYIEYDHEKEEYVLIHKSPLKEGIVDFSESGRPIRGMFSPNIGDNIVIRENLEAKSIACLSDKVAYKGGYRERLANGVFYPNKLNKSSWFSTVTKAPISKSSLQYESRFVSNLTQSHFEKEFKPDYNNKNLNKLGDFLQQNGITIGLEFETVKGFIPERLCYKYGLIPLRDGSISGIEYVTVPMKGRQGLYAVREICKELSKRTSYNNSCALHLHLGGLDRSEKDVLAMFILSVLMQDELFLLQPKYKRYNPDVSHGGFCKPLNADAAKFFGKIPSKVKDNEITEAFSNVFRFISDGREYANYKFDLENVDAHPSDPSGNRKWNINSRYFIINFVPIIFGNKKTVEFRQHHITNDFEKVIQLIFGSAMLINTVQNSKELLLDGNSELILKLMKKPNMATKTVAHNFLKTNSTRELSEIVERHLNYVDTRKSIMERMNKNGSSDEKRYDKDYKLDNSFWN